MGLRRAKLEGIVRRWVELSLLFVVLPALFMALVWAQGQSWLLLPGLWTLALTCLVILGRDPRFEREDLTFFPDRRERRVQLRRMMRRFIPAVLLMAVATVLFAPDAYLQLPRRQPLVWLLVIVGYPLLSVLPQGLIWRVFFVHRYAALFRSQRALLVAGALTFAFAHVIFQNVLAVVSTVIGGALFLQTYLASRSMFLATLEHAAYGVTAFTLGFGRFLYHGAIPLQ